MKPCQKRVIIDECIKIGLMYCRQSATEHLIVRDSDGNEWVLCGGDYPCLYDPRVHYRYD